MIICETEFNKPDPKNPGFSIEEVDMKTMHRQGYRVTLRKNLQTGKFEVLHVKFGRPANVEVVRADKNLQKIISFTNSEYGLNDQVCQHQAPVKADGCEYGKGDDQS